MNIKKKKSYEEKRTKKVNNSQFSLAPDHQFFNTGEGKIDIFIEIIATDDINRIEIADTLVKANL